MPAVAQFSGNEPAAATVSFSTTMSVPEKTDYFGAAERTWMVNLSTRHPKATEIACEEPEI
jgi:hypothetical protein